VSLLRSDRVDPDLPGRDALDIQIDYANPRYLVRMNNSNLSTIFGPTTSFVRGKPVPGFCGSGRSFQKTRRIDFENVVTQCTAGG